MAKDAKTRNKKASKRARFEKRVAELEKKLEKARRKLTAVSEADGGAAAHRSPLAPAGGFPEMPEIAGARFAVAEAGVRGEGRADVMVAELAPGTTVAGVFTRSTTRSAPVLDCQAKLEGPQEAGAAIVANSGNANAFTGNRGAESVAAVAASAAEALDVPRERVFVASTGVIGEPLPHGRIVGKLRELADALSPGGISAAARAIMTTDTFPKGAWREIETEDGAVRIAGIAKGSGMIAPDMATMLAFVFTDARISRPLLQRMLGKLADETFNRITVDGDTSTSDTLMVAATGASGIGIGDARARSGKAFQDALGEVLGDLARQVARDGEGATKFVEVRVTGAANDLDARKAALAIANSPLVKTAVAGEDPNWGRIVMAVGKSGAAADRDRLSIRFGDILVARDGEVAPDYRESEGAAYMKRRELEISADLGIGGGRAEVWTCDLTRDYVAINADYRS